MNVELSDKRVLSHESMKRGGCCKVGVGRDDLVGGRVAEVKFVGSNPDPGSMVRVPLLDLDRRDTTKVLIIGGFVPVREREEVSGKDFNGRK